MTMTSTSAHDRTASPVSMSSADPVRRILAIDAAFCAVAGTALLAGAMPIADGAGLAAPTVVRAIGAFLVILGVDLALLARARQRCARLGAVVTGVGDVGWAAGSMLLAATAGLPTWATAAVLAQAVLTLAIAAAKRAALRATAAVPTSTR